MSNNANLGKCDMVLSMSANSINDQFSKLHQRNIIRQNWNIVIFQDENGNVTNVKTNQSEADFQSDIQQEKFAYAFNADINPPQIAIISQESMMLDFMIPFNSGKLYCWTTGKAGTLQQIDMKGWLYAFNTGIGSIEKNTSDVNWVTSDSLDSCQQFIDGLGLQESQFSVETLFLDFENVNYSNYDQTKSVILNDTIIVKIFQNLLSNYFKTLAKSKNPYILAYGIKLKDIANQPLSLFQPTSLRYSTSYNDNPSLCAFNFLMMIGGHNFPADQDVGILPASLLTGQESGKMEIDKGAFSGVLSRMISPSLQSLCVLPSSSINANSVGISVSVSFSPDHSSHAYTQVNNNSSKVLTFSYSKSSHDSDTSPTFLPPFAIWGNITTTISVQSDVYLENNVIRINTTTTCFMHLNTEGGVSEGNLVKYNSEIKYTLAVDSYGRLTVTPGKPTFSNQSSFDTSAWSKFLSLGKIDNMVNSLKNFWGVMKQFLSGQQNNISLIINGSNCWAFPLGKTYTFSNVKFSNTQDLVADVNYISNPDLITVKTI